MEIEVIPDSKQNIKFWLDALSNPNISNANKELINKCLGNEINSYLNPLPLVELHLKGMTNE